MNRLETALAKVAGDLARLQVSWALVGGYALAVRAEPRMTRDIDVAVAVADDTSAEELVRQSFDLGYVLHEPGVLEQTATKRLATVRLQNQGGVIVDLLFASSGIEREVVASAENLEVLPKLVVPVATRAHLIALKVLAARDQDRADLTNLLVRASPEEVAEARLALELIHQRGFSRGLDLEALLVAAEQDLALGAG